MYVQPTMSPPLDRQTGYDWALIHWPFRDITQSMKSLPELRRFLCVAVRVDGQLRKKWGRNDFVEAQMRKPALQSLQLEAH